MEGEKLLTKAISFMRAHINALAHISLRKPRGNIAFVTATDSSHFLSLLQLLGSIRSSMPTSQVFVWDLGMTDLEKATLEEQYGETIVKGFEFDRFPSYFKMGERAGEYAWKPIVIRDTAEELKNQSTKVRFLIWTDAGNVFFRPLKWTLRFIAKKGVHTPFSTGTVKQWTHPRTLEFFGIEGTDQNRRNAHGAFVGFDLFSRVSWNLIRKWSEYALVQEVIAPKGSSRANHRQDQAVLTCLIIKERVLPDLAYRNNWFGEFRSNCDVEKGKGVGQRWDSSGRPLSRRFARKRARTVTL